MHTFEDKFATKFGVHPIVGFRTSKNDVLVDMFCFLRQNKRFFTREEMKYCETINTDLYQNILKRRGLLGYVYNLCLQKEASGVWDKSRELNDKIYTIKCDGKGGSSFVIKDIDLNETMASMTLNDGTSSTGLVIVGIKK